MKWFLLGFMCMASPNSPDMCRTFVHKSTYEAPADCAEASKPLVGKIVAEFKAKGLRRVRTYCALGEENRDAMLRAIESGRPPKLGEGA